jgi:hypothetical protein
MVQISVRNPVAEPAVQHHPLAPRVDTLDGKRLGLWWNKKVGGQFALEWFAAQLAALHQVVSTPFYGRYPALPSFITECAEASEIVIGTTGDCGSCTSTLIHDLIEIERQGVPTVALVAATFVDDAKETARVFGMPDLEIIQIPGPLTNLTRAEVEQVAEQIFGQVCAGLTGIDGEATVEASALPSHEPSHFTYEGADQLAAVDAFQKDLIDRGISDGFWLVPPTDERVAEMLTGTSLDADEVIAIMDPGRGLATVESIAINAVMAGCAPTHLPVLLAAVEAMAQPEYTLRQVAMSTGPHTPFLVVNGPIADRIGMNSGRGALGPGKPSAVNSVIGRAIRLIMMNIGYAYVGIFDLDTIGTPRKYSMAVAENEVANPWTPLHVSRGLASDESAVTVFSVESAIEIQDMDNDDPERLLRTFARSLGMPGSASVQHTYLEPTGGGYELHNLMVVCPDHAAVLGKAGWTREKVIEFVFEQSKRPKVDVLNAVHPEAMRPSQRWAADVPDDTLLPVMAGTEALHLIVLGGATGKSQYHTGIGEPATASIESYLPESLRATG